VSLVLDSSAVLAYLLNEPGEDVVANATQSDAAMSSVNLAEVMTRLVRNGASPTDAEEVLAALPFTIHPFDQPLALAAGAMFAVTRLFGLSLGDRACLALGRRENLPVLTADRVWTDAAPILGVSVQLIR
jgi:PIN domain nuclease of toxin-antitoxin system